MALLNVMAKVRELTLRSKHDPKFAQNTRTGDDASMQPPPPPSATISSLAYSVAEISNDDLQEESSSTRAARDNTVAAHAHQFKKVLELSDVIIQVCSEPLTSAWRCLIVRLGLRRCLTHEILWDAEVVL